jgi:hypothetical protein
MKANEIPQDPSALGRFTKEVCYAVDDKGNYVTQLSTGWEVKASALGITWEDIEKRVEDEKQKVLNGESSPISYFIVLRLMDLEIVSAYTGFWKWTIKRHLKPKNFKNLSDKTLQKYAELFEVSIEGLKTMTLS